MKQRKLLIEEEIDTESQFLQSAHFLLMHGELSQVPDRMLDFFTRGLLYHTESLVKKIDEHKEKLGAEQ